MKVIVNCDDVGMHEAFDDAALQLYREGIIRSLSLMPCGNSFESVVKKMKELNVKKAGVHLSLIGEPDFPLVPISKPDDIGTLICPNNYFYNEFPENHRELYDLGEIAFELENQILHVIKNDVEVTHLDGHRFFYEYDSCGKAVYEIVRDLAKKYHIPFRSLSKAEDRTVQKHCFTWNEKLNSEQRFKFYESRLTSENRPETMEILIHPSLTRSTSVTFSSPMRHDDYVFFQNLTQQSPDWLQEIKFCSWDEMSR